MCGEYDRVETRDSVGFVGVGPTVQRGIYTHGRSRFKQRPHVGVVPGVNQWMGQPLWWNRDKGGRSIGGIDEISMIDDIERDF